MTNKSDARALIDTNDGNLLPGQVVRIKFQRTEQYQRRDTCESLYLSAPTPVASNRKSRFSERNLQTTWPGSRYQDTLSSSESLQPHSNLFDQRRSSTWPLSPSHNSAIPPLCYLHSAAASMCRGLFFFEPFGIHSPLL